MSIHDLLPHDIRAASEAVFRKANQGVPDAAPPQDPDAQLPAGVPEDAHAAVAGALGGDRPEPAGSGRGVGERSAARVADSPLDILLEAHALVTCNRNREYGEAIDDFGRAVGAFNRLTGLRLKTWQGVLLLKCVKLSREMHGHKADNMRDDAGYAALLHGIREDPRGEEIP